MRLDEARCAAEGGIELDPNTRNIRDPELRKTLKRTCFVGHVRGPGTAGVRIIVPMGDLVTPLELYERAEAATTQEELAAIHEEARAHESWSKAEFQRRWRAMALEAPINPADSLRANGPNLPKSWIPQRGGHISFRPGQGRYLAPGVERYPPLIMPMVPLGRKPEASQSNSHSSHRSEAHSRASGRSAATQRRSGGRDVYANRSRASRY